MSEEKKTEDKPSEKSSSDTKIKDLITIIDLREGLLFS